MRNLVSSMLVHSMLQVNGTRIGHGTVVLAVKKVKPGLQLIYDIQSAKVSQLNTDHTLLLCESSARCLGIGYSSGIVVDNKIDIMNTTYVWKQSRAGCLVRKDLAGLSTEHHSTVVDRGMINIARVH
jgi:hypothetical protein